MSETLLPCPYCNRKAEIVHNDVGVFVGCFYEKCPVAPSTGTFLYEYASEAEAVAAWNTRAEREEDFAYGNTAAYWHDQYEKLLRSIEHIRDALNEVKYE